MRMDFLQRDSRQLNPIHQIFKHHVFKRCTVEEFLKTYIVPFGFRLVLAIVILIVGFALAKGLSKALGKSNALSKADPNAQNLIVNLVKTAIRVLTVLTAVMVLGVPQSSVIAVLGSCGLAIGLALQGRIAGDVYDRGDQRRRDPGGEAFRR